MQRQTDDHRLTRRAVLRLGTAALAGPFVFRRARAGDAFTWRRFAGQSIFVLAIKNPWAGAIQQLIPEFTRQTGISVELMELPEIQARQKLTVELTAGSSGIDAFYTSLHVEKRRFWKAGWYADLHKFLADPTMTAPEYDRADIPDSAWQSGVQRDGSLSALPVHGGPHVFFYRKDVFQQRGLRAPTTLAEMEEAAQKLHDPPRMYGFVARGLKNANAFTWDWALFSMGGNFLTKDGQASLNTPEAVKAMDYYAGILRRFGPPGVVNFNWYEASSAFAQGQVAMYLDTANGVAQIEDREKSKIAGKVGYRIPPAGPAGACNAGGADGLAISALSKHQGAAYFFAQWATAKHQALQGHLAGWAGVRTSVWNDPAVKADAKMPAECAQAYLAGTKTMRLGLPEIVGVTEYRDIIGVAIQKAIEGAKSTDVLAQAQREFQDLLNRTEG